MEVVGVVVVVVEVVGVVEVVVEVLVVVVVEVVEVVVVVVVLEVVEVRTVQGPELQGRVLNISPEQFAPPFFGLGSEHSRRLNFFPGPQVSLQGVQELQSDQPPSTKV